LKKLKQFSKLVPCLTLLLLLGMYQPATVIGKSAEYQPEIQSLVDKVSIEKMYQHLEELCWADGHQSRVTFTPGNYKAVEYIEEYFNSLPGITEVVLDTFYLSMAITPYDQYPIINVIATKQGESQTPELIILGGHYDASGSRESNWATNWQTLKAQGADDNASGVAAMLETARIITDPENNFQNKHTIKFIAFAAEEYHPKIPGVHHAGSLYDAYAMYDQQQKLAAVIVLDMIAYNTIKDYVEVISNVKSLWLADLIYDYVDLYVSDLTTNSYPVNVPYSDHESYQIYGFPAILLMENDSPWNSDPPNYSRNPHYHTQSDTIGTLRASLLEKVTRLALASVADLCSQDQITYVADNRRSDYSEFSLPSIYPNPFNESTRIRFYVDVDTRVNITIYNMKGEKITTLSDQLYNYGSHEITWNSQNLASGLYFCVIQSHNFNHCIKITHIK